MVSHGIQQRLLLALLLGVRDVFAGDQQPLYEDSWNSADSGSIHQIPDTQPPPSNHGNWLGFGGGLYNNHWASSDAVVDINNVATLRPFCQKAYDPGVSAAPLVENGIAYYPTWNGLLVALDYENCKTKWELNVTELILREKEIAMRLLLRVRRWLRARHQCPTAMCCTSVHSLGLSWWQWTRIRVVSSTHCRSVDTHYPS
jgi:hypothetical protein